MLVQFLTTGGTSACITSTISLEMLVVDVRLCKWGKITTLWNHSLTVTINVFYKTLTYKHMFIVFYYILLFFHRSIRQPTSNHFDGSGFAEVEAPRRYDDSAFMIKMEIKSFWENSLLFFSHNEELVKLIKCLI